MHLAQIVLAQIAQHFPKTFLRAKNCDAYICTLVSAKVTAPLNLQPGMNSVNSHYTKRHQRQCFGGNEPKQVKTSSHDTHKPSFPGSTVNYRNRDFGLAVDLMLSPWLLLIQTISPKRNLYRGRRTNLHWHMTYLVNLEFPGFFFSKHTITERKKKARHPAGPLISLFCLLVKHI